MNDRRLVIFGASGHAKVVIDIARDQGFEPVAVVDDNTALAGAMLGGVPVVGGRSELVRLRDKGLRWAIVAIGANAARTMLAHHIEANGFCFPVLAHSRAWIAPSAVIAAGTVVMPGAVINAETTIGRHVIINTCASVDHDCRIGDSVHIAPGAHLCGSVVVGAESLIGVGASIIPGKEIGRKAIIAAGSVVVRNIGEGDVVGGSPARSLKRV